MSRKIFLRRLLSRALFLPASALILCSAAACGDTGPAPDAGTLLSQACDAASGCDWQTALRLSGEAYRKAPGDTNVLICRALALENNGRPDEAFEIIRKAAGDRASFMAQYTFGRMCFQRENFEQALPPLKRAFELKPDDLKALILLEQTSAAQRSLSVKTYLIDHLWKKFPARFRTGKDPFVLNELGLFFAVHRQPEHAAAAFRKALKISPDSPEIHWNLAVVYDFHRRKPALAAPYYEKFLRLTGGVPGREADRLAAARRLREIRR